MRYFYFGLLFVFCIFFSVSCSQKKEIKEITVFYAPCFSPIMDIVQKDTEQDLGINLRTEVSGSQVVLRKITELGRECDVVMIADNTLFEKIGKNYFKWRIDFVHDEVVLGVGARASRVDEAETDWVNALLDSNISLGRVDENLGPIGYRTLMVWKLKEREGFDGLTEKLKGKTEKVLDDVENLAVMLKSGDIDYGFLYKSTCIKNDIRFIPLDEKINLGSEGYDYSSVNVDFKTVEQGVEKNVSVKGDLITYSLSVPENALHKDEAMKFIRYLISDRKSDFEKHGIKVLKENRKILL